VKREMPDIIKQVGFRFRWSTQKVWALDVSMQAMPISELSWHFDIPFWDKPNGWYDLSPNDVLAEPTRYRGEYQRILDADLKYPIDIMENKGRWLILDGLHRLVKAHVLNMEWIQVRIIPREKIPDILRD
jgi:hypothetical protein